MKKLFLTLTLLLTLPALVWAQKDVKIVPIKDNLHLLISPMGGNIIASTGKNGTFIIDDQLEGQGETIKAAIHSISDSPLKFILNTHFHFDHTGGNEFFGSESAVIIAHDNVRKRLSEKQFITYFKREMLPLSEAGLPVVTFADNFTLHYNDDDITITHVPNAHTDGDVFAYFTHQNVIVSGDIIFNESYPFVDTEHGGSIKGVITALDTLLAQANDATIIAPGHGPLMSKTDVQLYRNMLETIVQRVEHSINEGQTLATIIAAKFTQEYDDVMGSGIVGPNAFVTLIYEELKK